MTARLLRTFGFWTAVIHAILNKRAKPFYPSMDTDGSRVGVQLHDSRAPWGKLTGTSGHRQ